MELSNQEVKPFRQEKHQAHCSCLICDQYRHLLKKISNSKSGYPAVAFIADKYIFELWAGLERVKGVTKTMIFTP